LPILDKSNG